LAAVSSPLAPVARARPGALEAASEVPALPPETIARPRLIEYLDDQAGQPFTLVGAPAGAGKTVLLAAWAAARGAAWLTLGPRHADVRRLWRDVILALRQAGAEVAIEPPTRALDDGFALRLTDALEGRPALVLDDLHVLRGPALAAVEALVFHGGNRLRLLAATRADPALPLQRLRLQGRLGEVRTDGLSFTEDEAAELLDRVGVSLRADQVARLVERTEGWAAGLRLAGMSLRGDPDPDRFVDEFAGDDRAVADYLTDEVLAAQPPATRDLLLRTSVVERVCGELTEALTGRGHGARALAELERAGMFLVPLDRHGRWFRYHSLFGELLRTRLRIEHPDLEPELHVRAAGWLAGHDLARDAVAHAVAARRPDAVWPLLAEHWLELLLDGHAVDTAALPSEDPRLAVAAAAACLSVGDVAGARSRLDGLEATGEAAAFAALLRARACQDVAAARAAATEILERPGVTDAARALALLHHGLAEFAGGSPELAAERLEAGAAVAGEQGRDWVLLGCLGRSAALELAAGRLGRAAALAQSALAIAEPRGWQRRVAAAWAYAALAAVHFHRDELDDAERRADAAAAAAFARRDELAVTAVRALRAHLAAARGDADRARGLLRAVRQTPLADSPLLTSWLDALGPAPWASVTEGDGRREDAGEGDRERVAQAARRLASGDPLAAQRRLEPVLAPGRSVHITVRLHALLLDAVVRQTLGDLEAAAGSLEGALAPAAREGYRRVFASGGPPVRRLLERHTAGATAYGPLVVELLDAVDHGGGTPTELLEPLSDRERAVLRLLPTLLSNTEIAGELFVSVNTVKTHVKSIYRKLDVSSRREAVTRARELRLI
jgi:LuxR family maltose regulon positive regulatory protein